MSEENFSHFVSIQLCEGNGVPLYTQLADQLSFLIREGKLPKGFPLPPVRKFAEFLSINPGTVRAAYRELEEAGCILTRRGSGSFVEDARNPAVTLLSSPAADRKKGAADMRRIAIDPALFPTALLKDFFCRIIDRDGPAAFAADESRGFLPLREALAASLSAEGIATDAARIQIVSGSQQGIDLAARALLSRGSFAVTEDPTYPGAVSLFRAMGAKICGISLVRGGISPEKLEETVLRYRPRLLYLTPGLQVPTGIAYSQQTKARILALARRYDFYILEDDYASGLSFAPPGKSMKALDTHDRVLYLRSVSSLFADGLRLAFLVMPAPLVPLLSKMKYLSDIATAGLTQRVFDLFLSEGKWQPHVGIVRASAKRKCECALAAAKEFLPPEVSVTRPAGGLSLWAMLPGRTDTATLLAACEEKNFLFQDGAPFFLREPRQGHLRIAFGAASEETIREAFRTLGELVISN